MHRRPTGSGPTFHDGRDDQERREAVAVLRKLLQYTLPVVFGAIVAGVVAEAYLRVARPNETFGAARELPAMRKSAARINECYVLDRDLGFRPILGTESYSDFGTKPNAYPTGKRPHVVRVLFVGDSVTHRGCIIGGLRKAYGNGSIEYWNAGVEGYTTVQEVLYYERYNSAIRPDHVILTFVVNDFSTTPVAFWDSRGRLVLYAPNRPLTGICPWLFRVSYLYRLVLGLLTSERDWELVSEEIRHSLSHLQRILADSGADLTVLVLPILQPRDEWSSLVTRLHGTILRILREQGIKSFDLAPIVEQAFRDGVRVRRTNRDMIHPSEDVCTMIGEALYAGALLR